MEHHVKVVVDEAVVRSLAAANALLPVSVSLASPSDEEGADGKGAKKPTPAAGKSKAALAAAAAAPPTPVRSYGAVLMLDVSGLLVGDTSARAVWPDKAKGLPSALEEVAEGVEAELQLLSLPRPENPTTPAAGKGRPAAAATAAKPVSAKPGGKKGEAPPEPELKDLPGEPIGLLPPELITQLNPIVINIRKVGTRLFQLLPAVWALEGGIGTTLMYSLPPPHRPRSCLPRPPPGPSWTTTAPRPRCSCAGRQGCRRASSPAWPRPGSCPPPRPPP